MAVKDITAAVESGRRISPEDARQLLGEADFLELGRLANLCRLRFHPAGQVTFIIDRNINYTNICESRCRFCAFYRDAASPDAYLLSADEVIAKVQDAAAAGATQIMLQGGLHPDLQLEYFENLFRAVKKQFPNLTLHSLSPPEIHHLSKKSGRSLAEVLGRLRDAGLDSLPGGGAEILADRVREAVSPHKVRAGEWLNVMETAHSLGIMSTATMMMGTVETRQERIAHMEKIRTLQDRTGGFRAFIPWTFKPGNTELGGQEVSSLEYLRTLAVARIFLDNITHIQGSWVTQGRDIGQVSLHFGADDLGSIMLEENVVRAAGVTARITEEEMVDLIRRAGKIPAQRTTQYRTIKAY